MQALDAPPAELDLAARRLRVPARPGAGEFAAEYGERGLRAIGGRRSTRRALQELDGDLDVRSLCRELEKRTSWSGEPPDR